jgi:hypothetical protein
MGAVAAAVERPENVRACIQLTKLNLQLQNVRTSQGSVNNAVRQNVLDQVSTLKI